MLMNGTTAPGDFFKAGFYQIKIAIASGTVKYCRFGSR